jgi:ubiquinone/menaquinone biosynthesis C-methylase UbiE
LSTWDSISDSVQFSAPVDVDLIAGELDPDARIIDLGCGYGRVAAQLVEAGFENVIGYDSAALMIERGRKEFPGLLLNVGDANAIPEADGAFEAVVTSALLTSVPDASSRAEIIAEMKRLLVPGGAVFGVDFLTDARITYDEQGRFYSSAGIEMKHFLEAELQESYSEFTGWYCRKVATSSISGSEAAVLQYFVHVPANKGLNPTPDDFRAGNPGCVRGAGQARR